MLDFSEMYLVCFELDFSFKYIDLLTFNKIYRILIVNVYNIIYLCSLGYFGWFALGGDPHTHTSCIQQSKNSYILESIIINREREKRQKSITKFHVKGEPFL